MTAPNDPNDPLTDPSLSYTAILTQYLTQWGLQSLIPEVTKLGQSGASNDQISLQLQQTDAWKQRFAGNTARIAQGLAPLSPAQYIALEESYRQTLQTYGLPAGFYDSKQQSDAWIGGDVSASELANRAKDAADLVYNSPKEAQQAWDMYYGGGQGGAIAAILDPKVAEPLVAQQVLTAQIGGAALSQGLQANQSQSSKLAQNGVSLSQAQQAYSQIAQRMTTDTGASNRFGQQFDQTDEENATLLGNANALTKQNTLYAEEQSQFAAHGGASAGSTSIAGNY